MIVSTRLAESIAAAVNGERNGWHRLIEAVGGHTSDELALVDAAVNRLIESRHPGMVPVHSGDGGTLLFAHPAGGAAFSGRGWRLIREAADEREGGYDRLAAHYSGPDLEAACREVDRIVEAEYENAEAVVESGTVRVYEREERTAEAINFSFDLEGRRLISDAANGVQGGITRLINGFQRYGPEVLSTAASEVERIATERNPGASVEVHDGTLVITPRGAL